MACFHSRRDLLRIAGLGAARACLGHVDLTEGLIHVTQRADARRRIGKLKSRSGYRTISMPPLVAQALREWRLQCPRAN